MAKARKNTARPAAAVVDEDAWKADVEAVMRQIPGYNPWDHAGACGAWVDHEAAIDAINWFAEHLKHIEGDTAGEPFELRPWQAAVIANLVGWKRRDEKGRVVRRYRKCLLYIPRGNGKTPLAAGIVLLLFFTDHEPGAQCYLAAGEKAQASVLFRNATGMIDQDADLQGAVTIQRGQNHRQLFSNADPLSFCKVIPAEASKQHGGIPHVVALDELHVQPNRDLIEAFETGMRKQVRAQPLLMMLTTADEDGPSPCNEVYEYAAKVRDNGGRPDRPGHDPRFLPVIYEAPPGADWKDEKTWIVANPNMGVSVSLEEIRAACSVAIEDPIREPGFRQFNLNQRVSSSLKLIPVEQWDRCADPTLRIEDFEGRECFGGLDLSSREDLTSFYLVFPEPDDHFAIFGWSFCPATKVRQRVARKIPYDVWINQGILIETPGASVDYGMVREKIVECAGRFDIRFLYADPSGARETATILMEQHGFQDRFIEFTQSMPNLSGPTKDLIFGAKHGHLRHDGNELTRWAVGNVAGYYKGRIPPGQTLADFLDKVPVMPSKQMSADKIDPVAAIVNALAAKAGNAGGGDGGSVYDRREVLAF